MQGVTSIQDTSFTTYTTFLKEKKHHPQIQLPVTNLQKNVSEKKNITYNVIGKRKLLLDAFYPEKSDTKKPAIIIIHGGGWRSGNRTQHHPLAIALANKGYACFTPEYRLSTEALFPAAVFDIKEAIKWVRQNAVTFNIDTSKITIAGFSAGGQLAALVGSTANMPIFENYDNKNGVSTRVSAIIDIDGTLSFIHNESSEQKSLDKWGASALWLGYLPGENKALWELASPLSYAAYSPPVLFLNSAVERMHAGRNDYIKILDSNKVYSEVHTMEGSPHSFCLFEPWFSPTVNLIDNFIKKIFTK